METNEMERQIGFTNRQLMLLFFAFIMGVASVFTVDKVLLGNRTETQNVVQAATQP
ncbi:MAG: hypothetical protein ACRC10_08495 [Thermoguttaceae bacterium]